MRLRPATAVATLWIRLASRGPGFPASTSTDSPLGVTSRVEPPPSESIQ